MQDERAIEAIGRIELALERMEAALAAGGGSGGEVPELEQLRSAHAALRHKVEGAIGQIDRLLERGRLMANIEIEVASRKYFVACRDGEEAHLRSVAALVAKRASDATEALGSLSEARQLLFASLLLADDLKEARARSEGGSANLPQPGVADALERLAERMEALAERLENRASTS